MKNNLLGNSSAIKNQPATDERGFFWLDNGREEGLESVVKDFGDDFEEG